MYKIAILGCENSHANCFLDFIIKDKKYPDVEVVGVYSDDREAAEKLNATYGVPVLDTYDELVGKVDGVIVTARHGDNHYKFAKPYMAEGVTMFIDKPVTVSESDAKALINDLKSNNVKVSGGSVCIYPDTVQELKKLVADTPKDEVYGGYLRCPILMDNPYGGFFFYAQHLVSVMCEIFGFYPASVKAYRNGKAINCTVRYDYCDVNIVYVEDTQYYYATVNTDKEIAGGKFEFEDCFIREFDTYYQLLSGGEMHQTYEEFIAPVFILNAIDRSLTSGNEEAVNKLEEI